jgi:LCP family protein required for cell wall assembly
LLIAEISNQQSAINNRLNFGFFMRLAQKHPLIPLISLLLMASFLTGCADLARIPATASAAKTTLTATPRPTVTPLISPSSQPTFTPAPTKSPTATATPTATPPARPRSYELGVAIEITAGLTISGGTPVPTPVPLIDLPPGAINVLLLGIDARPGEKLGRTDTIIIVSVNPAQQYVTMLSLPRDLWVYIPGVNRFDRINTADILGSRYGLGQRVDLLAETIRYNLGIPVSYYAIVNFNGVRDIIDRVGGIEVLAPCPLYDVFPDLPPGQNDIITDTVQLASVPTGTIDIPTPGLYTLDGKHALWYARSRYSTSDFDRARRQQNVLRAVWAKIKAQGLVTQLPSLWNELNSLVITNLTLNDVIYLAAFGLQLDDTALKQRAVNGAVLESFTSETGAAVLRILPDRVPLVIHEAFAPPLTNVAAQNSAQVEVLNGAGRASYDRLAVDRLTSNGFAVSSFGPAAHVVTRTQLINFGATTKGSRLNQLVRLFNIKPDQVIAQPDAASPIGFRVVVGPDFDPCKPPQSAVLFPAVAPTPTPAPAAQP